MDAEICNKLNSFYQNPSDKSFKKILKTLILKYQIEAFNETTRKVLIFKPVWIEAYYYFKKNKNFQDPFCQVKNDEELMFNSNSFFFNTNLVCKKRVQHVDFCLGSKKHKVSLTFLLKGAIFNDCKDILSDKSISDRLKEFDPDFNPSTRLSKHSRNNLSYKLVKSNMDFKKAECKPRKNLCNKNNDLNRQKYINKEYGCLIKEFY